MATEKVAEAMIKPTRKKKLEYRVLKGSKFLVICYVTIKCSKMWVRGCVVVTHEPNQVRIRFWIAFSFNEWL